MKTVQDKDGNILQVADDTPCHAAKNGALPIILDEVLDAAIFTEMEARATQVAREELLALPKKLRVEVETKAHTVNGMVIVLDSKTETRLISALTRMQVVGNTTTTWKAENGFFTIDQADIVAIGTVIGGKISKAFNAQRVLEQEIADGTITTILSAETRFEELMDA